jgi:MFS transporter, ACS family, hexuronate transporter
VCGVLLLATMLNYMDRQALSQTSADISAELQLTNTQYSRLETGFGLAFAAGGLLTGLLVDLISVRWMYPAVVLGWSAAGFATAYASPIGATVNGVWHRLFDSRIAFEGLEPEASDAYLGLLLCRIVLGLFEAGQWPCALVTTQRLLAQRDRSFGNSILQSGASIGAIVTPMIVNQLVTDQTGTWRLPFAVIGAIGALWIIPWFALIRRHDLVSVPAIVLPAGIPNDPIRDRATFWRRFAALVCVVITINLTWHYFRAWLPKYQREYLSYSRDRVNYFSIAYYTATDVGCIAVGLVTSRLTRSHWPVHSARMLMFVACAALTALSAVSAQLPRGYALEIVLLTIGFGALGLFPTYYSLSQELSTRNQGKITGSLSAITWLSTAAMHEVTGRVIDATGSHAAIMTAVGMLPLLACLALWWLWDPNEPWPPPSP